MSHLLHTNNNLPQTENDFHLLAKLYRPTSLLKQCHMSHSKLDKPPQGTQELCFVGYNMEYHEEHNFDPICCKSRIEASSPKSSKSEHTPNPTSPGTPFQQIPTPLDPSEPIVRNVPQPLPLAHVRLHRRGTILEIHGNQSLTILTSPPPRTTEMVVSITCFRKYEARAIDYRKIFTPTSFTNTIRVDHLPTHSPLSNQPLTMNILTPKLEC